MALNPFEQLELLVSEPRQAFEDLSMMLLQEVTGASRLTGCSRTRIFELKALGKIKWRHLKKEGRIKGIVLIHIPTLLQFIEEMGE
jgi:hypothetical protein